MVSLVLSGFSNGGDTIVAEQDAHCVSVFNKNGEKVRSFSHIRTDLEDEQFTCSDLHQFNHLDTTFHHVPLASYLSLI